MINHLQNVNCRDMPLWTCHGMSLQFYKNKVGTHHGVSLPKFSINLIPRPLLLKEKGCKKMIVIQLFQIM